MSNIPDNSIAIIGLAGRFPGADNARALWDALCEGREAIRQIGRDELEDSTDEATRSSQNYVAARALLDDVDQFDADLFGFLPRDAELTDPQQRVLLETAWSAMEDAGYAPRQCHQRVGVYAGCSINTYLLSQLANNPEFTREFIESYQVGSFSALIGNGQDFLATRISYKLNLHGPAMTVQSACSTSLLAVAQACSALRSGQTDMAIAGGVSITFPQKRGYLYQPGGMVSPDGHCRPFDENAAGTVFGAGAGAVVLKRASEAVADGDYIYALICGTGMSNDGSDKVGYAAPSARGQSAAILMAHKDANVDADTISFVECHGTGTPLGDPIEVKALEEAFQVSTTRKQFCTISSLKGNIGHLDVAAGVTGLIKTALALDQEVLPGTLHYRSPNPKLELGSSPFLISAQTQAWRRSNLPRRAGVSAFGVGGTNVHAVLQEAPQRQSVPSSRESQLLVVSALTSNAVRESINRIRVALQKRPDQSLADAAYTLAIGREAFPFRATMVIKDHAELGLDTPKASNIQQVNHHDARGVAFLFPGQGSQYVGMGAGLYRSEPEYRNSIDQCDQLLLPTLGLHIRDLLLGEREDKEAEAILRATKIAQPALFVTSYAAARMWMTWGIMPAAMLGHSLGELVAACIAGVMSLEDALTAVAARGAMMDALPHGSMLAVHASIAQIAPYLSEYPQVDVAAENGPTSLVLSGSLDHIAALQSKLTSDRFAAQALKGSHAFHSSMVESIVPQLETMFASFNLHAPELPIASTVTGDWLTAEQAISPRYWAHHCRERVQFSKGLGCLVASAPGALLECGAGNTLTTLARRQVAKNTVICSTLPSSQETISDSEATQNAIGALWRLGASLNWHSYYSKETRNRIPLPGYSFQRQRFWMKPNKQSSQLSTPQQEDNFKTIMDSPIMNSSEVTPPDSTSMRLPDLIQDVTIVLESLSGLNLDGTDNDASFLELGLDSLFLTQLASELQKKYTIDVSFRQLLNELSSPKKVAEYLDAKLPQQPKRISLPVTTVTADTSVAISPTLSMRTALPSPEYGSGVTQLLQQQISAMSELFRQQMQTLGAASVTDNVAPALTPQSLPLTAPPPPAATTPDVIVELKTSPRFKQMSGAASHSALTPQQSRFIEELMLRYSERTQSSKRYTQQHRSVLADPRAVSGFRKDWKEMSYSLVVDHAKGSKLWDIDGNEYIDLVNGFGPTMFGHGPDFVIDAVKEQIDKSFAIGPQSSLAGETAALIAEMTNNERVTFCNTGSEAVMAAMRLARTVTGRDKIVFFAGDYHGQFDEVLVRGIRRNGEPVSLPSAPGIPSESVKNIVVLEYGEDASLDYIREHAHEFAAVIVEPVQSRHPNLQPRAFLRELRQITADSNTAFIFDEVVTGFRIHPGGAQAYFGIQADMATYGKVAAGGMPIGILAGKARFMDALDGGTWQFGDASAPEVGMTFFAGTFVRHPLALAATRATLMHIRNAGEQLYRNLNSTAEEFAGKAQSLFAELRVPFTLEYCGSVLYLAIPAEIRNAGLLFALMRERGVYVMEHFPIYITTSHTAQDLEKVLSVLRKSILELQQVDLLPNNVSLVSNRDGLAPLTAPQMEILLTAQMGDEQNCAFNESCTMHLEGDLDYALLNASWCELVNRHDALRLTLADQAGMQIIRSSMSIPIVRVNLSDLNKSDADAEVNKYLHHDARTPFDLYYGPLLRATLLELPGARYDFVITAHHIICDGWSINILISELASLYSAAENKGARLPKPMSFVEYARTTTATSESTLSNTEAYWKNIFMELPPTLELPKDQIGASERTYAGDTLIIDWPEEVSVRLRKSGAALGCTPFVTLLGIWQMLLMRLASQREVVVMIPSAAQSQLEESTLVGHCVHLLPIRGKIESAETVADFLSGLKQCVLDAYEHQELTFGTLVQLLKVPREPGRLPLSEVQFNFEKVGANVEFSGLRSSFHANAKAYVNFDLFLNIVDTPQGLRLECDFNSDLYHKQTIQRWLVCYREMLEGFFNNAHGIIDNLSLLSGEEQLRQLAMNNPAEPRNAPIDTIIDRIRQQATANPDKVAIEFYGQKLTYADLWQRSTHLAKRLLARSIGKGELVGIYLSRSINMVTSIIAILQSGAAYVPLDPLYPRERIAEICEETSMRLLLTSQENATSIDGIATDFMFVDDPDDSLIQELPALSPTDIAYVIFTSGSTGKPKGVQITHGNLINALDGIAKVIGFDGTARLLAVTTLSFDIAALELLMPLLCGAAVIIARREDVLDGQRLLMLLKASRATIMQATPITWRMLVAADMPAMPHLTMLCGGESWDRGLADELLIRNGVLWNMYGPTETTIWSAFQQVLQNGKPIGIEKSLPNQRLYILDAQQQLVPDGVSGELYIAGEGVGAGYYKRPELTLLRFLEDIFSARPGSRMYRTGDRVRRREDGSIEFCGRFDDQIKLRGFRIEPGEIESALRAIPGVDQAFVALRTDRSGAPRLVAYTTHKVGYPAETNTMLDELGTRLPEYMIPALIVPLSELPLTGNGKVDRKRLPEPDFTPSSAALFVAPRTEQEKQLAGIWCEVLALGRVSIDQPLLSLGADSLHVFQIAARAQQSNLPVTARQLMKLKTIEAICGALQKDDAKHRNENVPSTSEIGMRRAVREHYRVPNVPEQTGVLEQA